MQPRFDIPSHFIIMRDCLKLYIEEKERLRTALKGSTIMLYNKYTDINPKY